MPTNSPTGTLRESSAADVVLSARGISKTFGHVTALTDVSLDVAAGEVLVLMGDNGAGKSPVRSTRSSPRTSRS